MAKPSKKVSPPAHTVSRGKLWLFRVILAFGGPLLLWIVLELTLRLGGFGYPTHFLLSSSSNGQKTFIQNNQFGWRFFGRQMAREPYPFSIPQIKPPNTVRIFVFGESAAYGDPQPRFGLSRMLAAMLGLRYPGARFEVVNTGMTGINSHTILPIARDCAAAGGDIWVIYMGNNEVVGPFGAGTVFGPQAPPLPLIRANLALKSTRTGQLLDSLGEHFHPTAPEKSEWGGMLMFLDNQVRADDPRMKTVYQHFSENLADILHAGRRSGAGIVLSTVAVNLKDCAPFASTHRANFSETDKTNWNQLYQWGVGAQNAANHQTAEEMFRDAEKIDDTFAELHFRRAQCELALGQITNAQKHYEAARQFDTLRFRCDSRLNDLTRSAAQGDASGRILLADAEHAFAEQSPNGLPGNELFYDHVHLTFEGNYLLARTIAAQLEKLLPHPVLGRVAADQPWPSLEACAQRLCYTDRDREAGCADMLGRLMDPPFISQLNHDAQIQHLTAQIEKFSAGNRLEVLRDALKRCESEVTAAPDDPELFAQLASLQELTGDLAGAAIAAQREAQLLPSSSEAWLQLGLILVQERQFAEAADAFRRATLADSQDVWSLQNLAQCLMKLNRRDEAMRVYHQAIDLKPRFGLAWLGLGQALEAAGDKTQSEECYRKALANRIHRAPELATLARFCAARGWHDAAATNFDDAIKMNPTDGMLRVEAGQNLAALGRHPEAKQLFADAARLGPDLEQAHFLYGLELGQAGDAAGAVQQFREAVRIMPKLAEARVNLGLALAQQGQYAEALTEFETVLQQNPSNQLASKYIQAIKAKLPSK